MTILAVGKNGKLSSLTTVRTAKGAHWVAADERAGVRVCDPQAGQLLFFHHTLPVPR